MTDISVSVTWANESITLCCEQVKLDALNDSKQIALSIYNVVVLSLLGAVISLAVDDDVNVTYGAISTLQIIGTMITINTVFMPKVSLKSLKIFTKQLHEGFCRS